MSPIPALERVGQPLLYGQPIRLGPVLQSLTGCQSSDIVNFLEQHDTIPKDTHAAGIMMNRTEMQAYWQSLLDLRARHNGDVSHLADEALRRTGGGAAGNLSNMPIHMADLGTDNFEQEFTLSLLHNEEQLLDEIAAALERINQGTFGQCEECQGDIPKPRLQAVPYARYCVDCARKLEHKP